MYELLSNVSTPSGGRAFSVKYHLFRDDCTVDEDERDVENVHARDIELPVRHEGDEMPAYSFRFG